MKAKKITIEYEGKEPLEIIIKDSEAFSFNQTNGVSEGFDEKTNSIMKMPNGNRYIKINIGPMYDMDFFENNFTCGKLDHNSDIMMSGICSKCGGIDNF